MDTLYCNDPFDIGCSWSGDTSELVCTEDEPDGFNHCSHCEGTDFYEEECE